MTQTESGMGQNMRYYKFTYEKNEIEFDEGVGMQLEDGCSKAKNYVFS